jgi:two-component system, OmpR family, sensor histidine kinase TctE
MTDRVRASGSIRRRLLIQLLSGAGILALILFFVVQDFTKQLAEENQDNILRASVTSVLDAAAVQNGQITIDIPYSAFSMLGNVSDDRIFYKITQNSIFLTGYDSLPDAKPAKSLSQPRVLTANYLGEEVRLVTSTRLLSNAGAPVLISVTIAQTRNGQKQTMAFISRRVSMLGFGFFAIAAMLTFYSAQSTVRPLRRLAVSVSRRGPQDLRPVAAPVPSEMVPLVDALNKFMGRLKKSLGQSEEFIAEAAHRVRTPLATVRTQAEVTLHRVERDENRAALREMIRAIDESSRAAGQLLDHAMVTFRTDYLEVQKLDLREMVFDLVENMHPVADLKDIVLDLENGSPINMMGDGILIQNAVRNLIDNAIKYSPVESLVKLIFIHVSDKIGLIIQDEGIGFPEEDRADLTKRFVRGSNVGGRIGSGLGLTIADDVVRAHGGSLSIENNAKGNGACVTLYFPSS